MGSSQPGKAGVACPAMSHVPKTFRGFMRAIGKPLPTVNSVMKAASRGPSGPMAAAVNDAGWALLKWALVALALVGAIFAVIFVTAGVLSWSRDRDAQAVESDPAAQPAAIVDPPSDPPGELRGEQFGERPGRRRHRRRPSSTPPEATPAPQRP